MTLALGYSLHGESSTQANSQVCSSQSLIADSYEAQLCLLFLQRLLCLVSTGFHKARTPEAQEQL